MFQNIMAKHFLDLKISIGIICRVVKLYKTIDCFSARGAQKK